MKNTVMALVLAAVLCGGSGCAHMEKVAEANRANYGTYAVQQRGMDVVKVKFAQGVGQQAGSITITGLSELSLAVPLTPLNSPTPERGLLGEVKDAAVGVAPYAMGAFLGGKALDAKGDTVINNEAAAEAAAP